MSNIVPASLRALAVRPNHKLTRRDARMLLLAAEMLDAHDAASAALGGSHADARNESSDRWAMLVVARAELRGLLELMDRAA